MARLILVTSPAPLVPTQINELCKQLGVPCKKGDDGTFFLFAAGAYEFPEYYCIGNLPQRTGSGLATFAEKIYGSVDSLGLTNTHLQLYRHGIYSSGIILRFFDRA